MVFQPLMVGLAVEVAGALVEQVGGETGGDRLVRLILGGAAMESVIERDQRHGMLAHQPGLDAGRADDLFDRHRRGGGRNAKQRKRGQRGGEKPRHDFFSACGLTSLIRKPVTERRLSSHWRAASCTSSAVTARMRSGQRRTSSTVAPVIRAVPYLSLIHISEPTRRTPISYAVFCLKQ